MRKALTIARREYLAAVRSRYFLISMALVFFFMGGGMLLTHSHASLNLKTEFLLEVTHAPLGVLGLLVGWGRWLELRLAAPEGRLPGRLSAGAMAVIGVLLLIYRES